MPDGSLVVFDEAQDWFPPRSTQSTPPPHVAWLNKHRHKSFDILITTQFPKLVDGSLRALVGKHKHYRRLFGRKVSMMYEWDGCSDSLSGMKNATTTPWKFPSEAYQWYKSAEIHTKQTYKLPMWLFIPVLGLIMGVFFVPQAYSVLAQGVSGQGLQSTAKMPPPKQGGAAASRAPAGAPDQPGPTAPASDVQVAAAPAKRYTGCISNATKCQCLTDAGEIVDEPQMCRESSQRVGLLVAMYTGSSATPRPAIAQGLQGPSQAPARVEQPAAPLQPSGEGIRQPEGLQ